MENYASTSQLLANSTFFYNITIDMEGNYSHVSDSYDKNFEFYGGSLLGKPFSITLHPQDIEICSKSGEQCFRQLGKLIPVTLRKHDGMGGYIFTQWEMQAMVDEQGTPKGIFCIGYNITQLVHTQLELASAQTEVERKKDQMGEISFMQSHIIRKPLANIMGLTSLLLGTKEELQQQNLSRLILESTYELDGAIKSITKLATEP